MKIGGVAVSGPKKVTLVLPRDEGNLVFYFVAVTDDGEFDKMFPEPEPPVTFNVKLQQNIKQFKDEGYIAKLIARNKIKNAWIMLQSIAPSNIEWDTVKLDQPDTFPNWETDLRKAGLSIQEVNAVYDHFGKANFVTEEMLDEARKSFLASQAVVPPPPQ